MLRGGVGGVFEAKVHHTSVAGLPVRSTHATKRVANGLWPESFRQARLRDAGLAARLHRLRTEGKMRIDLATISEVIVREDVGGGLVIGQTRRGEEFEIFLGESALEELESLLAAVRMPSGCPSRTN